MQAVAGHMTQRIGQYSPQSLSNVMWAFATQETHPGSATLDAVALFVCKSLQVCHIILRLCLFVRHTTSWFLPVLQVATSRPKMVT